MSGGETYLEVHRHGGTTPRHSTSCCTPAAIGLCARLLPTSTAAPAGRAGEIVTSVGRLGRAVCSQVTAEQAAHLLTATRAGARSVKPARLGYVGAQAFPATCYAIARGECANGIPYVIEAWTCRSAKTAVNVNVNRSPITGVVNGRGDKRDIDAFGCGLSHTVATAPKDELLWLTLATRSGIVDNNARDAVMRRTLFRLWVVATGFWWAFLGAVAASMAVIGEYFDGVDKAEWIGALVGSGLGPPTLILALGVSILWAFGAFSLLAAPDSPLQRSLALGRFIPLCSISGRLIWRRVWILYDVRVVGLALRASCLAPFPAGRSEFEHPAVAFTSRAVR